MASLDELVLFVESRVENTYTTPTGTESSYHHARLGASDQVLLMNNSNRYIEGGVMSSNTWLSRAEEEEEDLPRYLTNNTLTGCRLLFVGIVQRLFRYLEHTSSLLP